MAKLRFTNTHPPTRFGFQLALVIAIAIFIVLAPVAFAQFGSPTRRIISGANLPSTCLSSVLIKDIWYKTGASAGLYVCTAANTWSGPVGAASGDVVGPASSIDGQLALFDSTTGKLLKASVLISSGETLIWPNAQITLGSAAGDNAIRYIDGTGPRFIDNANGGNQWTLNVQSLTANRAQIVPDVAGTLVVGSAVATTVGAAGGASALPATPLGYLTITLPDGSAVKVPYYTP